MTHHRGHGRLGILNIWTNYKINQQSIQTCTVQKSNFSEQYLTDMPCKNNSKLSVLVFYEQRPFMVFSLNIMCILITEMLHEYTLSSVINQY